MLDPLTLDQLRILVAVAETGSFSAAARKLQRVQSAVSQSVATLETTLQLTLFDRTQKRPRPTEAGKAVIADARRLIEEARVLRARAESMAAGLEAELTVAVDQFFPAELGMRVLRALGEEFPLLSIRWLTEAVGAPQRHLRDGTAHLAIYPIEITGASDLEAEFLTNVQMIPVAAPSHPLAQQVGPLSREVVREHVQLVLTDASAPGTWSRGIISHRIWRFADVHTRLNFLLGGFGWCNMPSHMVEGHLASGTLKRLDLKGQAPFTIALHVVHQRGRTPGVAARWLIERLRREMGAG
ncbi:MAG TPA: LysR family transcriptional regulator [Roseomonas sp.]|nr:LysR family transcriptional regulator [Roseomonas sp.]